MPTCREIETRMAPRLDHQDQRRCVFRSNPISDSGPSRSPELELSGAGQPAGCETLRAFTGGTNAGEQEVVDAQDSRGAAAVPSPRRCIRAIADSIGKLTQKRSISIAALYHADVTTVTMTLSNGGTAAVTVGSASLGGRHPEAFSIDADGCSNRTLGPGGTCEISVWYNVNAVLEEGYGLPPDHHALLKIPNDDRLAPELSVALYGERGR